MFSAFDRTRVHFGVVACSAARTVANVRNSRGRGDGGRRREEGARREMGYTRDNVYGVSRRTDPALILMTDTSAKM